MARVLLSAGADARWLLNFFFLSLHGVKYLCKSGSDTYPSASIWDYSVASHGPNGRLEPPLYTACRLVLQAATELFHWFHNWRGWHAQAERRRIGWIAHPSWGRPELDRFLRSYSAMVCHLLHLSIVNLHDLHVLFSFAFSRVATKGQRPLLVAKLLAAGSRVGSTEDYPWSQCPLYLATKYLGYRGRHQLAMFLMAAGADPTRMDSKGRSAIYWSLRNRDNDLFAFMIDSYNPRCWEVMLQRRVEELLAELPENHLTTLQQQWYNPPSLAKQCRLAIRLHLLQRFNYRSLFLLVPRLPVPAPLQRFLLVRRNNCLIYRIFD